MKKALSLILAALLAASLCACGNNAAESTSSPEPTATAEATATPTAVPTPTAEPTPEPVADYKIGDSIETDNFKMTFDSIELLTDYRYATSYVMGASDGYKMLLLHGHFENKSTTKIPQYALLLSCKINDTYEYDDSSITFGFESGNSGEISPQDDLDYFIRIDLPEKAADSLETVVYTVYYNDDMSSVSKTYTPSAAKPIINADQTFTITENYALANRSAKPINIGDTVTTDDYEMTLVSVGFSYDVLPSNTSGYYRHFPADSGKVYINVVADVKNTMKRDITLSELYSCTGIYDDDYTYSGFTAVDDGDGSFLEFNSDVAAVPLATCKVHSLIECPVEVDESDKPVTVQFKIGSEKYEYKLR